ncbi:nitrilase-related carbon-nitrogen hydrolase [Marinomonas sp. 5E14-1]|uniref:nitrilase-related carbon-nitrogen hydrolase n=1 Tax=Marinomonas sp. 5E14-1 TaxID=3153922 RepID=UPI003263FE21
MKNSLYVSVAQINSDLENIEKNIDKHLTYIKQAEANNSDLILFPELSLTGYQLSSSVPDVALKRCDPIFEKLSNEAPNITIIVGFVEEEHPGEYYNSVGFLKNGKLQACYRKINLPSYGKLEEGKIFHKGSDLTSFPVEENWNASSLICADLWNPALVHCAMLRRPELLLAPINSASNVVSDSFSNEENWLKNIDFYAMTYATPILMANRFGQEKDIHFWGGSRIVSPTGKILAKADDKEELISAELSLKEISRARFELPTIRDADTNLISRLLHE